MCIHLGEDHPSPIPQVVTESQVNGNLEHLPAGETQGAAATTSGSRWATTARRRGQVRRRVRILGIRILGHNSYSTTTLFLAPVVGWLVTLEAPLAYLPTCLPAFSSVIL